VDLNFSLLTPEIQAFITQHLNSDISVLVLKGTSFTHVSTAELVTQIEAKRRCQFKLPTWFHTNAIYYPNKLNIEQTSSERTAAYKASLLSGSSIIDITGGFGVDCFYFSKHFNAVTHCETNSKLSQIVAYNYKQLQATSIAIHSGDGLDYLKATSKTFDWIYVDPSRRNAAKGKVFFLKDCLPDVPSHLDLLFSRAKHIMVKTAPLLDITAGIKELQHVKTLHIVALHNEVKELLWILEHNYKGPITVETVNLKADGTTKFKFNLEDEKNSTANYSMPLNYLYEPNAAILKSGAFNEIATQLQIDKLQQHSHLYTSTTLIEFPGRRFKIEHVVPYNKKELKRLGIKKANITTRNFPDSVQQLRKRYAIKDGGTVYLFFTTAFNGNKLVLVTTKIASH
jgi:hypothetical protein